MRGAIQHLPEVLVFVPVNVNVLPLGAAQLLVGQLGDFREALELNLRLGLLQRLAPGSRAPDAVPDALDVGDELLILLLLHHLAGEAVRRDRGEEHAARLGVGLEDGDLVPLEREVVGGREAGRARADDRDGVRPGARDRLRVLWLRLRGVAVGCMSMHLTKYLSTVKHDLTL